MSLSHGVRRLKEKDAEHGGPKIFLHFLLLYRLHIHRHKVGGEPADLGLHGVQLDQQVFGSAFRAQSPRMGGPWVDPVWVGGTHVSGGLYGHQARPHPLQHLLLTARQPSSFDFAACESWPGAENLFSGQHYMILT